ncbi:hypothetical protein SLEP1_g39836 [Rubroshorea leprosula]|uniref:Uncharacterized protein n=1 Tax=Rubroshorea leprosula TaxID=152421 RepID=A0AAV5L1Q9_9ROSI|nr:hypothetical protein SLEP1_g39836 [Rubroshorea leprosula]
MIFKDQIPQLYTKVISGDDVNFTESQSLSKYEFRLANVEKRVSSI